MIAAAVAVSCVMGTGAFATFQAEDEAGQSEGKSALIQTEEASAERKTEPEPVRISWWICPTGGFADEEKVEALVGAFEKEYPGIEVDFRILDERTGEREIDAALAGMNAANGDSGADSSDEAFNGDASGKGVGSDGAEGCPDVVLAAPEYIVTKWGGEGHMADLTSLWDEETQREYRSEMKDVSKNRDDVYYAAALYRDLYTMAINYDMFEKAGALQYLNEEAHSWKDSGFIDAILRVHDVLVQEHETEDTDGSEEPDDIGIVGKVYCRDQTGQRPFMCFVSNFFKTGLVDDYHSSYQIGKKKIRDVFGTLKNLIGKGIEFDPEMDGDDENEAFLRGDLFITFNWSAAKQRAAGPAAQVSVRTWGQRNTGNPDGEGFRIYPMMYPNAKNVPTLTGPIGALGVVETEDEKKKDAAMTFVRYLMSDEDAYRQAVLTAGCFPARRTVNGHDLSGLYGDDEVMKLYETLNEYYAEYEPMMELYPQMEEAWPELLREIADGAKVKKVTTALQEELNDQLEEEYGIKEIEMEEEE